MLVPSSNFPTGQEHVEAGNAPVPINYYIIYLPVPLSPLQIKQLLEDVTHVEH